MSKAEIEKLINSKNSVYVFDNERILKLLLTINGDELRTLISLMEIHAVKKYTHIRNVQDFKQLGLPIEDIKVSKLLGYRVPDFAKNSILYTFTDVYNNNTDSEKVFLPNDLKNILEAMPTVDKKYLPFIEDILEKIEVDILDDVSYGDCEKAFKSSRIKLSVSDLSYLSHILTSSVENTSTMEELGLLKKLAEAKKRYFGESRTRE